MQPTETPGGSRGRTLKRYGPLLAIVVVLLVIAGVFAFTGGSDDDGDDGGGDEAAETGGELPEGVIPFDQREEFGLTEADFGDRCDPETGQQAYPSFFAGACMAPFEGDNGGATATGVTEDSIKIVWYQTPEQDPVIDFITSAIGADDTNEQEEETMRGFLEFFETFSETYGRSVDLETYVGTGPSDDDVAAQADAVTIAEDIQPFMVWGGPQLTNAFAEELAAREVPCLACTPSQPTDFYLDNAPYVYGITSNNEQGAVHVANFIGRQLAGGEAEFAGDESMHDQERVFGAINIELGEDSEAQVAFFEDLLAEYDVEIAERTPYADPVSLQPLAANMITKLKDAGVTTVIMTSDPIAPSVLTREATAQDYFPEWIVTGSTLTDTNVFARTYDQEQWANAFGVSQLATPTSTEVAGYAFLYEWFTGEEPPADDTLATFAPLPNTFYNILQGVGPDLTVEGFRDAIFRGQPTPRSVSQPSLSWGDKDIWPFDDYLGIDDAHVIWYDPDVEGRDETGTVAAGMYQHADGGTRYLPDEWPTEPIAFFDPDGAVTIYDERPAEEGVPDYPSPAG